MIVIFYIIYTHACVYVCENTHLWDSQVYVDSIYDVSIRVVKIM